MAKGTKYSQQFKEDAVQYRLDHPEMPLRKAAENLGVSESALKNWMKAAKEHKRRSSHPWFWKLCKWGSERDCQIATWITRYEGCSWSVKKAIGILGKWQKTPISWLHSYPLLGTRYQKNTQMNVYKPLKKQFGIQLFNDILDIPWLWKIILFFIVWNRLLIFTE